MTLLEPVTAKPTTAQVMVALRERFAAPEFAFFEEVGDSGSSSSVYADGVALNMWASRGYAITGFEVKVSRSDWLRELKQPDKAEPVYTKCDYWYLVAPDDVYVPDEVPPTWGILAFKDGKLREKRKAPKLEPKPITRAFVAQMFRRASGREERDISARVEKAIASVRAAADERIKREAESRTSSLKEQAAKWDAIVKGLDIETWSYPDDVIAAVKVVLHAKVVGTYTGLDSLLNQMRAATKNLESAAAMFQPPVNSSITPPVQE